MKSRRTLLLALVASVVGLGVVVLPAIADELFGVLTEVDVEGKKVTVVEKDTDKEVEVTITDDTAYATPTGSFKIDLDKLALGVEGAKEKGKKGITVKVTHEKGVASKITVPSRKKGEPKPDR